MLGVAIRIAQRMGIHSESALAKCTVVEAEMRRRLWWSLILFDTRISEIANSKTTTLDPTWDCKIPLNVNDSDLRPEMKGPPAIQGKSTEALFAVVRSELGEFIRHTVFHLDFTNPALKPIAKHLHAGPAPEGGELVKLEEMIEDQYLKSCDQENPIHFMTIWTTRAYLAKCRLLEHHSRYSSSSVRRTEAQRDAATSYALRMLECDTKIMTSPLTKGFLWLNHFYFPFPAYIQIVQDLRRRPISEQARQAWEVMSDNYEAWFDSQFRDDGPFFQIFTKIVLQAWEACEAASKQLGETLTPPRIVSSIRHTLAQKARHARNTDAERPNIIMGMGIDEFPMSMPMPIGFANQSLPYSVGMPDGYAVMRPEIYSGIPGQAPLDAHMNQLDWTVLGGRPGWGSC
jgi:Fungal specific transcription factor domain